MFVSVCVYNWVSQKKNNSGQCTLSIQVRKKENARLATFMRPRRPPPEVLLIPPSTPHSPTPFSLPFPTPQAVRGGAPSVAAATCS